jgi:hypothetical protein
VPSERSRDAALDVDSYGGLRGTDRVRCSVCGAAMKTVDQKCQELAEYFLTGKSEYQVTFLAKQIQRAIADALQFLPCPTCGNEVRNNWPLTCECAKGGKK